MSGKFLPYKYYGAEQGVRGARATRKSERRRGEIANDGVFFQTKSRCGGAGNEGATSRRCGAHLILRRCAPTGTSLSDALQRLPDAPGESEGDEPQATPAPADKSARADAESLAGRGRTVRGRLGGGDLLRFINHLSATGGSARCR